MIMVEQYICIVHTVDCRYMINRVGIQIICQTGRRLNKIKVPQCTYLLLSELDDAARFFFSAFSGSLPRSGIFASPEKMKKQLVLYDYEFKLWELEEDERQRGQKSSCQFCMCWYSTVHYWTFHYRSNVLKVGQVF